MATKTSPAEILAETRTAQQTTYDAAVPLDLIQPHPKNIRHNAVADDELVDSIREQGLLQPLVVIADKDYRGVLYRLVAGHRRFDGLKKAGFTHAPAIIRRDLDDEGDQVAAMLVENGRREDLSAVEEAEGIEDLFTVHGWDVERISATTGRSKSTVNERRKLTRLPEKAKTAVEAGQVTIDAALRLSKLPAADQTHLEKLVGRGDFEYELRRTEERAKATREHQATAKKLRDQGVPEITVSKSVTTEWQLNHADHGAVRLPTTGHPNADQHDGCLAFILGGTKQYPSLWYVCTDPAKHDAALTEAQLARKAEEDATTAAREQRIQEAREEQRATDLARQLRCDAVLATLRPTKTLDPTLELLIRLGLPWLVSVAEPGYTDLFHDLAGTPDDQRWKNAWDSSETDAWATALQDATPTALVKNLAAYLLTHVESLVSSLAQGALDDLPHDRHAAATYFAALESAGHQLNARDIALRNDALNTNQEES